MALSLFAVIPVNDYPAAVSWYETLLGGQPSFEAHATEVVWELAEDRSVAVLQEPAKAGNAMITVFVDDLDAWVDGISERGIAPAKRETYGNGVCKVTYRDADGNEIGFGGLPR